VLVAEVDPQKVIQIEVEAAAADEAAADREESVVHVGVAFVADDGGARRSRSPG
jgi:hypothetical protein